MTRVLVARTGSVWRWDTSKASPTGEQSDAVGVAKWVAEHYDCALLGRIEGDAPGKVFNTRDYQMPKAWRPEGYVGDQEDWSCVDRLAEDIAAWEPDVLVEICGPTATMSNPNNHKDVKCLEFAVQYIYPILHVCQQLKLPRICVVNDPRNYPKDQEMSVWEHVIPAAVLSQCDDPFYRRVDGKKYLIEPEYAGCENWWSYKWENQIQLPSSAMREFYTMIAHSHFEDGRLQKNDRNEVWSYIWPEGIPAWMHVYGNHWDKFANGKPPSWHGACKPDEVHAILQQTIAGPIIPIANNWVTAKLRQYVLNGALPLLYGKSPETNLAYDAKERYVRFDSPLRFEDDVRECIDRWRDPVIRTDRILDLLQKTEPNFIALERAISCPRASSGYQPC